MPKETRISKSCELAGQVEVSCFELLSSFGIRHSDFDKTRLLQQTLAGGARRSRCKMVGDFANAKGDFLHIGLGVMLVNIHREPVIEGSLGNGTISWRISPVAEGVSAAGKS